MRLSLDPKPRSHSKNSNYPPVGKPNSLGNITYPTAQIEERTLATLNVASLALGNLQQPMKKNYRLTETHK